MCLFSLHFQVQLQTISSKSARGHLLEGPKMYILLGHFWYFAKVVAEERWSQPERNLSLIWIGCDSRSETLTCYVELLF